MTYSFKSSTSKRKNNEAFAEKIWKAFIKKTQGAHKTQGLSNCVVGKLSALTV